MNGREAPLVNQYDEPFRDSEDQHFSGIHIDSPISGYLLTFPLIPQMSTASPITIIRVRPISPFLVEECDK